MKLQNPGSTFNPAAPGAIGGTTPAAITGTTLQANTSLLVTSGADATKAVQVRGTASQSANLQEWQNSAGTMAMAIPANGQGLIFSDSYAFTWKWGASNIATMVAGRGLQFQPYSTSASYCPITLRTLTGNTNPFMECIDGATAGIWFSITSVGGIKVGLGGTAVNAIRHGISGAMTAGAVTVTDTGTTASTKYLLLPHALGTVTVAKPAYVSSRSAGASFVITSADATDTSTWDWWAYEN